MSMSNNIATTSFSLPISFVISNGDGSSNAVIWSANGGLTLDTSEGLSLKNSANISGQIGSRIFVDDGSFDGGAAGIRVVDSAGNRILHDRIDGVADASLTLASVQAQLNLLLAALRSHGLIN